MIVRVRKHMLRKGMYVEAVECTDLEFSRRRFLLDSDAVLQAIMASSAEYVLVNYKKSKGEFSPPASLAGKSQPSNSSRKSGERSRIQNTVSQATTILRDGFDDIKHGKFSIGSFAPAANHVDVSLKASPDLLIEVTRLQTKDEGTYVHSLAVSGLMTGLGHLLDLSAEMVKELTIAGLLHDLGKLLIPNAILNKNGQLTNEERLVVRSHPERGYALLKQHPEVSDVILDVCRFHHEVLDGSGYPVGLRGDQLSLPVRICTVCDVFDALTSARPYKSEWSTTDALKWMFERGHLFDRNLILRLGSMLD